MEREDLFNRKSLTMEEMAELYVANNPGFIPNTRAVGRYAKRIGFQRAVQLRNKKQVYFYIKPQTI